MCCHTIRRICTFLQKIRWMTSTKQLINELILMYQSYPFQKTGCTGNISHYSISVAILEGLFNAVATSPSQWYNQMTGIQQFGPKEEAELRWVNFNLQSGGRRYSTLLVMVFLVYWKMKTSGLIEKINYWILNNFISLCFNVPALVSIMPSFRIKMHSLFIHTSTSPS